MSLNCRVTLFEDREGKFAAGLKLIVVTVPVLVMEGETAVPFRRQASPGA